MRDLGGRRVFLGVLALALLARLPNMLAIPLFYDDAIYLYRALVFPALLNRILADGLLRDPLRIKQLTATRPTYLLLDEQERVAFDFDQRFPEVRVIQVYPNPWSDMRFYA